MAAYFFESSALVKRYARETGSAWVISLFRPVLANRIYVARLADVEIISALTRRMRRRSLGPVSTAKAIARFRRAFHGKFRVVEITDVLTTRAASLAEKYALRGYDAVQLAAALTANEGRLLAGANALVFVSADRKLNAAAGAEGLMVQDPNTHP